MDEDENEQSQQHNFPFRHQFIDHHIMDDKSNENLAKVLRNLETIRRQQQETTAISSSVAATSSLLKSVCEEDFTSQSHSSSSSFATTTLETTGGNGVLTDKKNANAVIEVGACPIGKTTMFQSQQKQQQQLSIASSSSSASDMTKRAKTLSFLHNEDLLTSTVGTSLQLAAPISTALISIDDKSFQAPASSSLYRSMSFQERRQYQHQASLKRVESGKELKSGSSGLEASNFRKVTILSPKHSLHELNERIKSMQQQMFYGSSELSL